jgi:hypothetical protein
VSVAAGAGFVSDERIAANPTLGWVAAGCAAAIPAFDLLSVGERVDPLRNAILVVDNPRRYQKFL